MDVMRQINGYVWKLEDTPSFVAGRVEEARRAVPRAAAAAVLRGARVVHGGGRYSWHTPGTAAAPRS